MNKLLTVALAAVATNAITLRDDDDATGNASGPPPPPPAKDPYTDGLKELATSNDSDDVLKNAWTSHDFPRGDEALTQGTLKSFPNLQYVAEFKTHAAA